MGRGMPKYASNSAKTVDKISAVKNPPAPSIRNIFLGVADSCLAIESSLCKGSLVILMDKYQTDLSKV